MSGFSPYRVEGYAIVSADGMIADANGLHPESLWLEADQRFYQKALARADLVVHGRNSKEFIPGRHSAEVEDAVSRRRRIIVTSSVKSIKPVRSNALALYWNPAGANFEDACEAVGVCNGTVVINGGAGVYQLFLKLGYNSFYISTANEVFIPDGRPLLPEIPGRSVEEILSDHDLRATAPIILDASKKLTMVEWVGQGLRTRVPSNLIYSVGRQKRATSSRVVARTPRAGR